MHKKHMILMLICCLIPAVLLGGFLLFQPSAGTSLLIGVFLLCPLIHGLLMYAMMKRGSHEKHDLSNVIPSR